MRMLALLSPCRIIGLALLQEFSDLPVASVPIGYEPVGPLPTPGRCLVPFVYTLGRAWGFETWTA